MLATDQISEHGYLNLPTFIQLINWLEKNLIILDCYLLNQRTEELGYEEASYDLTGLPPSLADIENFLSDHSDNSFEVVVDRLLDSPHYGEKWARHWMDLVKVC